MINSKIELKGKILLGAIGAALGGPYGGALGVLLGHFIIDKRQIEKKKDDQFSRYKKRQALFMQHTFALCSKLAKSKGSVNRDEVQFMERLIRQHFKLSDEARYKAIEIWNTAKASPRTFESFAESFYAEFRQERHQIVNMMDVLFAVAAADQNLHPREEEMLLKSAGIFQIGRMQYERIKSRHFHTASATTLQYSESDPHYAILGATPQDSLTTIKKKYRELAQKWHPDKIIANGASPAVIKHAQEKFQHINEAYEYITKLKQVN